MRHAARQTKQQAIPWPCQGELAGKLRPRRARYLAWAKGFDCLADSSHPSRRPRVACGRAVSSLDLSPESSGWQDFVPGGEEERLGFVPFLEQEGPLDSSILMTTCESGVQRRRHVRRLTGRAGPGRQSSSRKFLARLGAARENRNISWEQAFSSKGIVLTPSFISAKAE
jgi:hypothetical protein